MNLKLWAIAALSINVHVASQNVNKFIGEWEGKLSAGVELRLKVHIKADTDGNISSTLDSPDQSVFGIVSEKTTVNGNEFEFELKRLNVSYSGHLLNDSTIDGVLVQGAQIPLILTRKQYDNVPLRDGAANTQLFYKTVYVSAKAKHVILQGTLFHPLNNQNPPVVLIISGSGPTDRDGNNPLLPGKNNCLRQLADSLARYGIASMRYDKRGIGKSLPDTIMREEDLRLDDFADDAMTIYRWLKEHGYQNIYIAGHSEGSLIGMMAASKVAASGFISIAGAGRNASDILKEQVSGQLSGQSKTNFDTDIDSLQKGLTVSSVDASLMSILRPSIQPYMRSWLRLDPRKIIGQLSCPVLIVQGTNDLQVGEIDARNLHKAQSNSKLIFVKNMNHVLKDVDSDDKNMNIAAYSNPGLPINNDLVAAVVSFIRDTR